MAKIQLVKLEDAVGLPLSHDLTQIDVQTGFKGARFKKGQFIREEDIPLLRSMGKETITVLGLDHGEIHEDDAARRVAERLAGEGVEAGSPEEGKISLSASWNGLLVYDQESIHRINSDPEWAVASIPDKTPVKKGDVVAGVRIIPLFMKEEQVRMGESAARAMAVFPFYPLRTALVTTGTEFVSGRSRDAFAPRLSRKLAAFGSTLMGQTVTGDAPGDISGAVLAFAERGAELVIVTGGMSVDGDDRTAESIVKVGEKVVFKGVPVIPGANLMLALRGPVKIVGAPACVAHSEWTSLDILLPRLFAGIIPSLAETRKWGAGGLCRHCRICSYPICSFGAR